MSAAPPALKSEKFRCSRLTYLVDEHLKTNRRVDGVRAGHHLHQPRQRVLWRGVVNRVGPV